MLVYGDPQYTENLNQILDRLRRELERTDPTPDSLRTLLIRAGQLEQGVEDAQPPLPSGLTRWICAITDLAARAFLACQSGRNPHPELEELKQNLLRPDGDIPDRTQLTIKVPEGYEFYTLFPEQYFETARDWALKHSRCEPRRVLVVGIRSIGTSLSAAVKAVLEEMGWAVERRTLRPGGNPFERSVRVEETIGTGKAIIVDEGPGLSGSSIHAVAVALRDRGVPEISVFPGHPGLPGSAASPVIRRFWEETPRYFTPLGKLPLSRLFSDALRDEVLEMRDFSGGLWRERVFPSEAGWPPVVPVLERTKFLCRHARTGLVLWKFSGLGSLTNPRPALDNQCASPTNHPTFTTLPPLASAIGFTATRWVEGSRPSSAEGKDPEMIRLFTDYLAGTAGPVLTQGDWASATGRLSEMLVQNTFESLGKDYASRARGLSQAAQFRDACASYSDGRMGPWEWVRDHIGRIWKADFAGHVNDHTCIGVQPLAWDIAGLAIEWNLPPATVWQVIRGLSERQVIVPPMGFPFYLAAYAAFRLGICTLFESGLEGADRNRLLRRGQYYRACLHRCLSRFPVAGKVRPVRLGA